jgi:NitT/TauT family transport system substrate-binding protein
MEMSAARLLKRCLVILALATTLSCSNEPPKLHLAVSLPSLTASKLPFVIAMDQKLYEKHGLDVELYPSPGGLGLRDYMRHAARYVGLIDRVEVPVSIDGAGPMIVGIAQTAPPSYPVIVGSTDCVVRAHVIGRKGLTKVEEVKGKRLGVSTPRSTSGYHALLLAKRMGWDPVHDVAIILNVDDAKRVLEGSIDAMIGYEREYADAKRAGLPILLDMKAWNEPIAGNSINAKPAWLAVPANREAAKRFLKATIEAIALLHQRPEIAVEVLIRRYGIDEQKAKIMYSRAIWTPPKPYPCYDGIEKTMQMYDSVEMRKHKAGDFYDDSLMREIDQSGFIDTLYQNRVSAKDTVTKSVAVQ